MLEALVRTQDAELENLRIHADDAAEEILHYKELLECPGLHISYPAEGVVPDTAIRSPSTPGQLGHTPVISSGVLSWNDPSPSLGDELAGSCFGILPPPTPALISFSPGVVLPASRRIADPGLDFIVEASEGFIGEASEGSPRQFVDNGVQCDMPTEPEPGEVLPSGLLQAESLPVEFRGFRAEKISDLTHQLFVKEITLRDQQVIL